MTRINPIMHKLENISQEYNLYLIVYYAKELYYDENGFLTIIS